jgi:hypothetical protein
MLGDGPLSCKLRSDYRMMLRRGVLSQQQRNMREGATSLRSVAACRCFADENENGFETCRLVPRLLMSACRWIV